MAPERTVDVEPAGKAVRVRLAGGGACEVDILYPAMGIALALYEQSQVSVITGDLGIADSIRRAWKLVTNDFWRYLLMSLILYVVVGFALGLILTAFMIPMFIPIFSATANGGQPDQNTVLFSLLCVGLLTPFYALIQGLYLAFVRATWTVANLHPKSAPVQCPPSAEVLASA